MRGRGWYSAPGIALRVKAATRPRPASATQRTLELAKIDTPWTFPDPPETEVITLRRVLDGTSPLRLVTHDADDGSWQFLDNEHLFESDAAIVTLAEVLQFDPSLEELANLPLGWFAYRSAPDQPWQTAEGDSPSV